MIDFTNCRAIPGRAYNGVGQTEARSPLDTTAKHIPSYCRGEAEPTLTM